MSPRIKKGINGVTEPRTENVLGTVIVRTPRFNNIKGEIIAIRDSHLKYLTVQVQSEYRNRVYVLHLMNSQYTDIQWRH